MLYSTNRNNHVNFGNAYTQQLSLRQNCNSSRNYSSALLTFHGVGPRPPEPRDFRLWKTCGVARQPHCVAFAHCDVRTGQMVNDLRRNWTRDTATASIRSVYNENNSSNHKREDNLRQLKYSYKGRTQETVTILAVTFSHLLINVCFILCHLAS